MRSWTIRAFSRALRLAAIAVFFFVTGSAAGATMLTDPVQLYANMKRAFDRGAEHGWKYDDQIFYFGTILDAGRAYSLVRPGDPNYMEVARVTVDVAALLHYDPLTNSDASVWYVREACAAVVKSDPARAEAARAILMRLDASDADVKALAKLAETDAAANVKEFHDDPDALIAQADTDVRAYYLTKDPSYRSIALGRVAEESFPIAKLPDPPGVQIVTWANSAVAGAAGFSAADVGNAREILRRRAALKDPPLIGRVVAIPHDVRLLITAPADEYFGREKMSPLGIENELTRIARYLDAGWGTRMTTQALDVASAIDEWQKGYPRDYALPRTLLAAYRTFSRIDAPDVQAAAQRVRTLLTIEYGDSPQARELLGA
jgi:hypothetical protein